MAYYLRVFCTAGKPPPLRPVLEHAIRRGSKVSLDATVNATSLDDPTWRQVGIAYKRGRQPFLLEVNRDDGPDSLVRREVDEFLEFVEDAPDDAHRRRVEDRLRATTFVVAAEVPTSDMDGDGYDALGDVLTYFVDHNGGMIQADGEGFYEGTDIIVPLE
jgi:hypothetical protein